MEDQSQLSCYFGWTGNKIIFLYDPESDEVERLEVIRDVGKSIYTAIHSAIFMLRCLAFFLCVLQLQVKLALLLNL